MRIPLLFFSFPFAYLQVPLTIYQFHRPRLPDLSIFCVQASLSW